MNIFKKRFISLVLFVGIVVALRFVTETLFLVIPEVLRRTGFRSEEIKIAGTGSMYPTFPKGSGDTDVARAHEIVAWSKMKRYPSGIYLLKKRWFGYHISRGDIVSFSNAKTSALTTKQYEEELGYVKRVIGVGGDKVEIRDGFVNLNGKRLNESYTARPRSTFGGSSLPDCLEILIPKNFLFVLGDNRTGSSDSRHDIGLVHEADVDHVMSLVDQGEYKKNWRDASGDESLLSQPTIDTGRFVEILNEKRKSTGLPVLTLNNKLIASAKKRGEVILASDDLSFEATRSGYGMEKALRDVGYSNITWGEAPAIGFYTAEELIENSFQFPDTKEFLLDKTFDDIGVTAVLGEINGCPSQVVVQHFGGYVPPNYSHDVIDNWKKALVNLREVRPSWVKLRESGEFYTSNKKEVDRMIELIDYRIAKMTSIIDRMEKNEWLTAEEKSYATKDASLYQEQDQLAKQLNSR